MIEDVVFPHFAVDEEGADSAHDFDPITLAHVVGRKASGRAQALDRDGAFPAEDIGDLHRVGLLSAPLPLRAGGIGLGTGDPERARQVMTALSYGSLALGRLYEGHVNAIALVARYGSDANLRLMREEAVAGYPSGVWMAGEPLQLERHGDRFILRGKKILCSGAGHFHRPLVAAEIDGGSIMIIPKVCGTGRTDSASWTAQGMQATATGSVDFTGIEVDDREFVGKPGDYLRSPYFRGGAWRVIAVQLGGLQAVMDHYRHQLRGSPYRDHPLQLARFGEAMIAFETARLWIDQASRAAESPFDDAAAVDAYVDLARNAFEAAALQIIALAQKAIGLKAFLRPNPLERIVRDLSTYLRQPALDVSLMSAASFHLAAPESYPL